MKNIVKSLALATATAAFALSVPASAQLKVWEDYEPQEEVIELTYVKVEEGQLDFYLEGLKSTWVKANEIQKEMGTISGYGIYVVPFGANEVNLVLRITYPNMATFDPNKEKYDAMMEAWGKANMDSSQETVREVYNKIREIKGTYILRPIEMKMD